MQDATIKLILDTSSAIKSAEKFGVALDKCLNISDAEAKSFQASIDHISKKAEKLEDTYKDLASLRGKLGAATRINNNAKKTGTLEEQKEAHEKLTKVQNAYNAKVVEATKLQQAFDKELDKIPYTEKEILAYQQKINSAVSTFHQTTKQAGDAQDESLKELSNNVNLAQLSFKELTSRIYNLRKGGKDATLELSELTKRLNEFKPSSATAAETDKFLTDTRDAIKFIKKDLTERGVVDDVFNRLKEASVTATKAQTDLNNEIKKGVSEEQSQVNFAYAFLATLQNLEETERERLELARQAQEAETAQYNANTVLAYAAAAKQAREEDKARLEQLLEMQAAERNQTFVTKNTALIAAYKQIRAEEQAQLQLERELQQEAQNQDEVNKIYALIAAYRDFNDQIIMTKSEVQGVAEAMATDTAKDNIAELIRRYNTLAEAKKQMESMGLPKELDGTYATTLRLLTQLTGQIKDYKNSLNGVQKKNEQSSNSTKKLTNVMRGLNSALKTVKSGFKSLISNSNGIKTSFSKMANSMRSNFKHMITSMTKYVLGFRSLFFLVRRLRKYIGEGIENMAKFNDGNNHVNESITRLLSSLLFLKNAWATAFSPILQFVTPILEHLIDAVAEVGNAFSRLLGGLLGQTTVFQAVKVRAADYAGALDDVGGSASGAADKTKKLTDRLAAFDDLNVLGVDNDPDSTGSGGGGGSADAYVPDPNEMFKLVEVDNKHFIEQLKGMWERADFSELGKSIKEKIMGALESINWEEDVYPTVRKVMSSLGTFIVGLFGDPKFWEDLGDFGAGLFNAIIYGLQAFLETTDGVDFGGMIASGLNKFLTGTDWEQAGLNVNKLGKQLIDNLISFFNTTDKRAMASAIADFLKGVNIPELAIGVGKLILTAASVSIDIIGGIIVESALDIDSMSPEQLAYVTESWTNFVRKILLAVVDAFTAGTGLGALLVSLIDPPKDENGNTDWAQIGYDIADGILFGFGNQIKSMTETGTWFAENVCQPIINAVKEFFKIGSPSKVMEEYGGYIGEGLLNGISALMPDVEQIFTNFKKWLEDTWYNIRTTAVSNFWTMKTKIVEAFDAIKDGIKSPVNGLIGIVEGMVNAIIDGINGMLDKLNSMPDFTVTNPFNGNNYTLGIDLPNLNHVSIPRLAQGAVIPPNREFMAVLGDQSHGTNIEAPLDTIKQAVAEVLANNGNAEMIQLLQQLITVVESKNLVIGDKDIGRANARYTQQQNRIRGVGF